MKVLAGTCQLFKHYHIFSARRLSHSMCISDSMYFIAGVYKDFASASFVYLLQITTVESKSNAKTKEKVKTSFLSSKLKMKTSFSLGIKFVFECNLKKHSWTRFYLKK